MLTAASDMAQALACTSLKLAEKKLVANVDELAVAFANRLPAKKAQSTSGESAKPTEQRSSRAVDALSTPGAAAEAEAAGGAMPSRPQQQEHGEGQGKGMQQPAQRTALSALEALSIKVPPLLDHHHHGRVRTSPVAAAHASPRHPTGRGHLR